MKSFINYVVFLTLPLLAALSFASFAFEKNSALVIIDMQPNFVTRNGNDKSPKNQKIVKQIIQTQIEAIKAAEKAHIPIIFIEYAGEGGTNKALKMVTKDYKNTIVILKDTDGMLDENNSHRKELIQFLTKNKIKNLIISGANGGACVFDSIQGALRSNYSVIAYTNGIADFNYTDFIYPYSHQYDDIKPDCTDCTFSQVDNLNKVLSSSKTQAKEKQECMRQPAGKPCKSCDDMNEDIMDWMKKIK